jgi:hypothetical protein
VSLLARSGTADARGVAVVNAADRRALHVALLDAFPTIAELQRVVSFGLETTLDEIAPPASLSDQTLALVLWCDRHNRVGELLASARSENPGNEGLKAFGRRWDAGEIAPSNPRDRDIDYNSRLRRGLLDFRAADGGLPVTADDLLRLMNFALAWFTMAVIVLVVVYLVGDGRAPWWAVLVTVGVMLPVIAMFNRGLARPAQPSL